jgi:hypothetical protein
LVCFVFSAFSLEESQKLCISSPDEYARMDRTAEKVNSSLSTDLILDSDWQPYLDKEKHARYLGGRPDAMSDDERNEYEGFKTEKQYGDKDSLWNQKVAHPNAEAAAQGYTADRGDAEEWDIQARLRRGERVDPDNPPGTMTKRELASRIQQEGMPALASGAYTPEEFQKISRNAGQFQWQTDAEDKYRAAEEAKKKPQDTTVVLTENSDENNVLPITPHVETVLENQINIFYIYLN